MENQVPTEFAAFVRETGIRAFDQLARRADELKPALRNVIKNWGKLDRPLKEELFNELIESAQVPGMSSAAEESPSPRSGKRDIKRYDPDEVKKTLPKKKAKPAKKKAAASDGEPGTPPPPTAKKKKKTVTK